MTIKTLSFVMAMMLFTMPFFTLAQQNSDAMQAITDGRKDAQDSDRLMWGLGSFLSAIACGCIGGLAVVAGSQFIDPSPPAQRFLGKSHEYVFLYTDTYKKEIKSIRLQASVGGCLGGMAVNASVWWLLVYSDY